MGDEDAGITADVGRHRERPSRLIAGAVLWARHDPARPRPSNADRAGGTTVLPDGCLDLIWAVEGAGGAHGAAAPRAATATGRLFVAGPDTHAYRTDPAGGIRYVGLRFASGTGPAVIGVPASEVRDRQVPLDELWPADDVRRLAERLAAGTSTDEPRILEAVAAAALRDGAPGASRSAPRVDRALLAVVDALRGGSSVAAAAYDAGLSERQLHRRSLVGLGYGPKTLARILRLARALDLARAGTPAALVAADTGFADQAHLAREVRSLAGAPLGELLRDAGGQADSSSGA
jgi:AraC-like DNA-binding protein